jgi:NAD(P)H-flavin reductase
MVELEVRHEGHHHGANVKVGYGLFLSCVLGMIGLAVRNSLGNKIRRRVPLNVWVISGLWCVFISLFLFYHGSTEALNLFAKRVGRVCYGLLPLTFFLSLKPSPLPNTYYINLLFLHKWVSRSVVALAGVHGVCYLTYFVQAGKFHKTFKLLNFLGVVALAGFIVIGVTSLRPVRKRAYRLFYGIHYPLSIVCLVLGAIHARPGVLMLLTWCVFILIGQIFYRVFTSQRVYLSIEHISSGLLCITLPRPVLPDYFDIGSHIRLSTGSLWHPKSWISPSHPYTIASLPSDEDVKLLIRRGKLFESGSEQFTLAGPFSSKTSQTIFKEETRHKNVVVFAGGTGLSFAAPIVRQLTNEGSTVKLVWIIRDRSDYPALQSLQLADMKDVSVYITGRSSTSNYKELDDIDFVLDEDEDEEEGYEIDDLMLDDEDELQILHHGRPDFALVTEGFFNGPPEANWVVSCGPPSLVNDVQKWVNQTKKSSVQFIGEKYAL